MHSTLQSGALSPERAQKNFVGAKSFSGLSRNARIISFLSRGCKHRSLIKLCSLNLCVLGCSGLQQSYNFDQHGIPPCSAYTNNETAIARKYPTI